MKSYQEREMSMTEEAREKEQNGNRESEEKRVEGRSKSLKEKPMEGWRVTLVS